MSTTTRHVARHLLALALVLAPSVAMAQGAGSVFHSVANDTTTAALKTSLSLSVTNEPLRAVLERISTLSGVSVVFDDSLPGLGYRITLHVQKLPLREVLERVTDGTPLTAMVSSTGQVVLVVRPPTPTRSMRVIGRITDSSSASPVAGAGLELVGTRFSATSRDSGAFSFGDVPFGDYALRVTRIGFAPIVRPHVRVPEDIGAGLHITMTPATVSLSEVVVTPGYFGLLQGTLAAPQSMTREQLETVPQIGEDIYRAVARLPGVTADEFSAKFGVRGGTGDELYVSLDGLELVEPFHLKDLGGAFSIIDIQALGSASLTTGGFSAEYGDRLTGVFTMTSVDPRTDKTRTSAGISLMNARVTSQGGFAGGKGGWLVSARPGYLDLALKVADVNGAYTPRYYDVFAKAQYDLASGGRIAIHALSATDYFSYDVANKPNINSRYGSSYLWLTWDDKLGDRLRVESVASGGLLGWRRNGDYSTFGTQLAFVNDVRNLSTLSARQSWSFDATSRLLIKWGFDVKHDRADYSYLNYIDTAQVGDAGSLRAGPTNTSLDLHPSGTRTGAYVAPRLKLFESLTLEAGVRFDRTTQYAEQMVSPRLNVSWQPFAQTTLRAAWGRYSQSQPVFNLQVQDGINQFAPAQRAEQRILGMDQAMPFGITARVEAYQRTTEHPLPEFLNVAGDVNLLPELMWDRVRIDAISSRDRGLEFLLSRSAGRRVDWSASYALSSSRDSVAGGTIPREFDQRHAVHADWSVHPLSNEWRLSLSGTWHSGWPYTPNVVTIDTLENTPSRFVIFPVYSSGSVSSERLPNYMRIDARWTRYFDTASGRVSVFGELYNVLNAENPRGYWSNVIVNNRRVTIENGANTQFPRLPVAGFSWEF